MTCEVLLGSGLRRGRSPPGVEVDDLGRLVGRRDVVRLLGRRRRAPRRARRHLRRRPGRGARRPAAGSASTGRRRGRRGTYDDCQLSWSLPPCSFGPRSRARAARPVISSDLLELAALLLRARRLARRPWPRRARAPWAAFSAAAAARSRPSRRPARHRRDQRGGLVAGVGQRRAGLVAGVRDAGRPCRGRRRRRRRPCHGRRRGRRGLVRASASVGRGLRPGVGQRGPAVSSLGESGPSLLDGLQVGVDGGLELGRTAST